MTYVIWDVETTIRESFKRKANPFDPLNYVVMTGFKRRNGKIIGDYYGKRGHPDGAGLPKDWFTRMLKGTKLLVGHNIKFDVLYAIREPHNLEAWMEWVANGGNIWDTQLAEYLLRGMVQASHMMSLNELAPDYGGNTKFDEVKALWDAGVSTEEIDQNLLREYLCGNETEHGDIGNTELIFRGQLKQASAAKQMKSIMMNMGSLLCTIEMERNGMAVDKAKGLLQAAKLAEDIAETSVRLATHLPADLPFDFNWSSPNQKSAVIFGGKVKYEKRVPVLDDQGQQAYGQMKAQHIVMEDGSTMDADTFYNADGSGIVPTPCKYKSGKNAGELKTKQVSVNDPSKPKSRMEDFYFTFPRVTKPNPRWEGATPGVYSTGAEIIEELGNRDIPFLNDLSKVVSLTKDLSTYYISTDADGKEKGMLTLVQASGLIHHMLNHTSTVTARFSSSNPNLQNLPKEGKSLVKDLFVSRFEDGLIIQSDFSSLEVFCQAILTNCKQLIADLQAGLDMHCVRVSQKEGITYEEALDRCKNEDNPVFKEWKGKRNSAKIFSFQRAYGAGAAKISESAKIPLEDVEAPNQGGE